MRTVQELGVKSRLYNKLDGPIQTNNLSKKVQKSNQVVSVLADINNHIGSQGLIKVSSEGIPNLFLAHTSIPFKRVDSCLYLQYEDLDNFIIPSLWNRAMLSITLNSIVLATRPECMTVLQDIADELRLDLDLRQRSIKERR